MAKADILDGSEISGHTEAILRLKIRMGKLTAESTRTAIEIGRHLRAVVARLPYGAVTRYLKEKVQIHQTWSSGAIRLAQAAEANPGWAEKIAPLGPTKAMRAAYAGEPFRWTLGPDWTWKGVRAVDMPADAFDRAVDAADPGHRGRGKRTGGAKPPGAAGTRAGLGLPELTIAGELADLKELRSRERDGEKWRPLLDWLAAEFGPAAEPGIDRDPKRRLEAIVARLRQADADLRKLVTAKAKVGSALKLDAQDAAADLLDTAKRLAAWVSGTPRK